MLISNIMRKEVLDKNGNKMGLGLILITTFHCGQSIP